MGRERIAHLYSYFSIMDITPTLPSSVLADLQPIIASMIETDRLLTGRKERKKERIRLSM